MKRERRVIVSCKKPQKQNKKTWVLRCCHGAVSEVRFECLPHPPSIEPCDDALPASIRLEQNQPAFFFPSLRLDQSDGGLLQRSVRQRKAEEGGTCVCLSVAWRGGSFAP